MNAHRRAKILYLHHSGALDGSLISLCELLRFLDRERFEPIVALLCPGDAVRRVLDDLGVATLRWEGIAALNHATAFWSDPRRPDTWPPLVETAVRWRASVRNTLRLVQETRPDVVHVNSVILAPAADALRRTRLPFVWHVREMPERGIGGFRLGFQRRAMMRWPSEVIFLSEHAHRAWVDGARGVVVPELVDPTRFSNTLPSSAARRELGLADDASVVLYVGGMSRIKGFTTLIGALPMAAREVPKLVCLMPGTSVPPPPSETPLARVARGLGWRTVGERLERAFEASGALPWCTRLPFTHEVPRLMAASDVVVFPAMEDHFPRPVVEAGFMEKPVVASRLPAIEEALGGEGGGILVPPGDQTALAQALAFVLRDARGRSAMGKAGRRSAIRRFDASTNAAAFAAVYDRLIAARARGAVAS